jgi:hypothetical protein
MLLLDRESPSWIGLPFCKRGLILGFLHVCCDESGKHKSDRVVCFAALCVKAKALADFDAQWEVLLRQYQLDELHMVEVSRLSQTVGTKFIKGQTVPDRIERLKPFADCINDHMKTGMVHICESEGFAMIPEKQRKALSDLNDPYHLAFIRGLDEVARDGASDDHLAILCDDDEQTAWDSYRIYRQLRKPRQAVRQKVKALSFADSVAFPALQAADMISYLGRKEGELKWLSQQYEFRELLAYITRNPPAGKMQWKVAWFSKEKLQNAKNWRY